VGYYGGIMGDQIDLLELEVVTISVHKSFHKFDTKRLRLDLNIDQNDAQWY